MDFMDRDLSRRLERTEGAVGSTFIAARREVTPEIAACWHDFGGTYAMFDGADSPHTQTFGLGLFDPVTAGQLDAIEAYFSERGAPTTHEVSPLAGLETTALLVERGYRPIELSTVLVQPLAERNVQPPADALRVRHLEPSRRDGWIEASVAGWATDAATAEMVRTIASIASANPAMMSYHVERDGEMIATASLGIHEGVALLAGASTIPSARQLGAQAALLAARLADARERGCTVAMMVTSPGSASQRNAERSGFRVAYTRTKWQRLAPT
ncbi:MAG TPA: GNAT family N-acetyltransferase [Kofleriaceae bacterium]|nr:GNAT family N-acetyltransferase [Kofleriaceae bacterium]